MLDVQCTSAKPDDHRAYEHDISISRLPLAHHAASRRPRAIDSIRFYIEAIGLELVKRQDYPEGRFSIAFVGCSSRPTHAAMIELTYNWDPRSYTLGDSFGHVTFVVPDLEAVYDAISARGASFTRAPGPMAANQNSKTRIAFINDPDGHRLQFMQRD